jgi:hypothetical protein
MSRSFSVTTTTNSIQLDNHRHGEAIFSAFNASGQAIRGRARPAPQDPNTDAWLKVTGETERDFAIAGVQQFDVQIVAPPDAPAGNYTFRLDLLGVENPDEDLTQGPTVTFQVPEPEVKKPFPWWLIAVIAGLLVIGVVTIVILSQPKTVKVPDLAGLAVTEAEAQLKDAGLEAGQTQPQASDTVAIGQIISTAPAANTEAAKGTQITLIVSTGPASVPPPISTEIPGSGSCLSGFVWRLAGPTDKVCVLPESYTQAQADNVAADSRREVAADGPDTCLSGYVWREAYTDDHVCVASDVYAQAQADNAAAASRVEPSGGPYGPDTCLSGYVWRDAFSGDHVCVAPDVRTQAQADNAAADSRKLLQYGVDTCKPGYVWRDAFSGDHVCVTPDVRAQAQSDNSLAPSRTVP